ncbi:TPA: phytanoyl-CoA dioxygenase family protein, partial [Pseudomonas aeruginosa]
MRQPFLQSGVLSMSASRDTFSLPVVTRSTPAQEIALLSDQAGAVMGSC